MRLLRKNKWSHLQGLNLLDLIPVRLHQWEQVSEDQIIILMPKFRNGFLRTWLMPRLRHPYIRIKLDAYGSEVWRHCDGKTSVATIAQVLRQKFGEKIEPVYDRLALFIRQSVRTDLMSLEIESQSH